METEINEITKIEDLPSGNITGDLIQGCLVLEGGSFRGVYQEGILDLFMTEGLNFQCTAGVSAGALNGYNYSTGQIGRAARINMGHRHDSKYVGLGSMIRDHGIIGYKFLIKDCAKLYPIDEKFQSMPGRRFVPVATSCLTGETMYYENGKCSDILAAVQASASMPYYCRIVTVDGTPCLDGGCSVKVPFQWAIDQGYEKIAVLRTLPRDYYRDESKEHDKMARRFYRKYPEFVGVLMDSAARSNRDTDRMNELEKEGRIFMIAPPSDFVMSSMESNMDKLWANYNQGRKDAAAALPALKEFLGISETA